MKNTLFSLSAIFMCVNLSAQIVTTYAGMQYIGTGLYTGYRSNTRDSVQFSAPMGIEVDTTGRLYVSNEHNIFWIKGNTAFLAAGYTLDPTNGGAADSKDAAGSVARFSRPAGLAVNPNTNEMMVADCDNNQIRKVEKFINTATQQIVTTFAGVKLLNGAFLDGANASAKFNGPVGIAVAPNGDIYVADRNNHVIRKISGGQVTTIAGFAGSSGHVNATGTSARFSAPYNVFLDGNTLLVADYGNSAIRKIDLSNNAVTDLITSGLFGPKDLCKVGNTLFIVESLNVKKYAGNVLSIYAGSNSQQGYVNAEGTSARFQDLSGIVYHPKDNLLYVVDMGNNVVRSISPTLRPTCYFNSSTTSATKGQTIILSNASINKPDYFNWTIFPGNYSLLNNCTLNDSILYLSFSQTGTYSVKLYVSNGSGADSLLKSNYIAISTVTAPPVADFTASNTAPGVNEIISLVDLSTNTPTTWIWRISPPNFIWMNGTDSNSRIPNVKFTNGDNFTITLIAGNAEGSNSTTKIEYIKVNGSSIHVVNLDMVFRVFPNPVIDIMHINSIQEGNLMFTDIYGRIVKTVEITDGINSFNVDDLSRGTYILSLATTKGIYSRKIVINH